MSKINSIQQEVVVYRRDNYLRKLLPFLGSPVVKVITGMRRSGKSCLIRLLMDRLLADGVRPEQIVYVNKESYAFDGIRTYHDLAAHVQAVRMKGKAVCHVFVDEIQEIEDWERIVADWSGRRDMNIVITGSNAHLLSGDLATLLAGRYIEVQVFPLSFAEFVSFHRLQAVARGDAFGQFLRYGGLPGLHEFGRLTDATFQPFVSGVYNTIMLKDIVQRHEVRNYALLEKVSRYVFDNIGSLTNASRIHAFLKSQRLSVGVDTILNYMKWFSDANLTHRALLYDIKGRRHLVSRPLNSMN